MAIAFLAHGFTTRPITNTYRVHEPRSGLGLLAMCAFATQSNFLDSSRSHRFNEECARWLDGEDLLHKASERLGRAPESKKGAAPVGAAKSSGDVSRAN